MRFPEAKSAAVAPGIGRPPEPRRGRLAGMAGPVAVALLGFAAYAGTFHVPFVFDDDTSIVDNRMIRDLSAFVSEGKGYRHHPTRFVGNLSFALNYRLGGLDPTGYHVVNVLVHVLNALLLWALVRTTFRTPRLRASAIAPWSGAVATAAALLFVSHPIQTQAVTYVAQRFASLATTFYLLSVLLWARWRLGRVAGIGGGARGAAGYAAVLLALLLGMRTKEIAITAPVAIALYEVWFFEGSWRRRLAWLLPVLATVAVIPLDLLRLQEPVGKILSDVGEATRVQTEMSRLDYLATQLAAITTYLRLLVLPVGQNLDWDHPVYRSFLEPRVVWGAVVLAAVAAAAALLHGGRLARRLRPAPDPAGRLASYGVAWFFLALSVESSVIPIVDVIFEHRVYLPSAGLFAAVAAVLALAARRLAPSRPAAFTLGASAAMAVVLASATWARNAVWRSELSLWSDAVAKSPLKSRPRDNLGLALAHLGREPEAVEQFREAARLDPGNARAWNNLGVALAKLGRPGEAEVAFRSAIRAFPDHAEAHHNLGRIYLVDLGRYQEAAALFQRAIALRPDYPEAYANLGAAWNALGRYADTVRLLEPAAALVRTQPHAHFNLGLAYAALGDLGAARREVRLLAGLSPELAARLQGLVASAEWSSDR
ncbi:MAG TPA: tetratricopeptide repeat protein [Anaeromyxobacteraceae bacterium]|nr:tetratricopeptide repeat protein [Anaeromyxobacteraceae bacterium]